MKFFQLYISITWHIGVFDFYIKLSSYAIAVQVLYVWPKVRIFFNDVSLKIFVPAWAVLWITLFFANRCREKQRKEASRLQTVNRKLSAMNKLLMEENDRLQKQVSHLVYENGYMRQQLHSVSKPLATSYSCAAFFNTCILVISY